MEMTSVKIKVKDSVWDAANTEMVQSLYVRDIVLISNSTRAGDPTPWFMPVMALLAEIGEP